MSLPASIKYASSNGSPPDGLINAIKTKYGIQNPISSGIIKLEASSTASGNIETVVLWNTDCWRTKSESGSYIQLQFSQRYVFLSGYSIGEVSTGSYYSKTWRVQGFNPGEKNSPNKWSLLSRNTSAERNLCSCASNCNGNAFRTYNVNQRNKGFQFIRFTCEESSAGGTSCRFATSGLELYGTLSSTNFHSSKKVKKLYALKFLIFTYILIVCD